MENMSFEQEMAIYGMSYVDGTRVSSIGVQDLHEKEVRAYLADIKRQYPNESVISLEISMADENNVSLTFVVKPPSFARIRRITGYLVGTLDRFNNGKRAEEHDRVKHTL